MEETETGISDWRKIYLSYWQLGLVAQQAKRHVVTEVPSLCTEGQHGRLEKLLFDIHKEWSNLYRELARTETWHDIWERRILLPLSLRHHYDELDLLYEDLHEEAPMLCNCNGSHLRQMGDFLNRADEWRQAIELIVGDRKDDPQDVELSSGVSALQDSERGDRSHDTSLSIDLTERGASPDSDAFSLDSRRTDGPPAK